MCNVLHNDRQSRSFFPSGTDLFFLVERSWMAETVVITFHRQKAGFQFRWKKKSHLCCVCCCSGARKPISSIARRLLTTSTRLTGQSQTNNHKRKEVDCRNESKRFLSTFGRCFLVVGGRLFIKLVLQMSLPWPSVAVTRPDNEKKWRSSIDVCTFN